MAQQQQRQQYENRSRLGLAVPAIRPGMKGRMLLAGPSGAGKTFTALLIAMALREHTDVASVVMIDTEKDSGRTYADEFVLADGSPAYKHISWSAPYNAVDLAMTLRDASGRFDVVIVDSHSHFWRGEGGVLDVAGGRWTGWAEARPMQADMVDAILSCDCHVILCARTTQEHVQEKNEQTGKIEVRKLGMKIQQDSDLEYEMNVGLELDMTHTLRVTKSRTRVVPVGKQFIPGHAEEFAGIYRDWLKGGEPAATKEQVDALVDVLNRIADGASRTRAKQQFVETFGRPEMLLVSRLEEAQEWVADKVLGNEPTPDRAPDAEPKEAEASDEDRSRAEAGTEDPDRISQQPGMVPHAFAGTGVICTTCKAGKGHPLHQAPAEGDTAATTADPAEKPGEAPTAPEGEPQGGAAPDVEPAPGSTPDAAPPDDATAKALDRVKELEETAARSDSKADAEKVRKELIGSIVKWVSELPMAEIVKQLESRKFSTNGIPRVLRDALVDFYVNVAEGRTVDPLICEDCGGYQLVPPPFLEESKRCGCPI